MNKKLKTGILSLGLTSLVLSSFGCAKTLNKIHADGSLIGSTKAPYVVVNHSGGKIMDVYKLPNTIVQSEENSDGWLFRDEHGNPVHLGGDVKVIRVSSDKSELWDKYCEYHSEFDARSYQEACPQN